MAGGFFTPEPPRKPKNTGVGNLSFLQGDFLAQESNQDLLRCRRILSQLSYIGSQYSIYSYYKTWLYSLCGLAFLKIVSSH